MPFGCKSKSQKKSNRWKKIKNPLFKLVFLCYNEKRRFKRPEKNRNRVP